MYYVNQDQLNGRLRFIPYLRSAAEELAGAGHPGATAILSQERLLHLAIETVTDIGSLMIDGFVMRDASSYEDIVTVLAEESVFAPELSRRLMDLVKLRKPLVQDYYAWDRSGYHPLFGDLPRLLTEFSDAVTAYLEANL